MYKLDDEVELQIKTVVKEYYTSRFWGLIYVLIFFKKLLHSHESCIIFVLGLGLRRRGAFSNEGPLFCFYRLCKACFLFPQMRINGSAGAL